jgi:hypothetical protein
VFHRTGDVFHLWQVARHEADVDETEEALQKEAEYYQA